MYFLLRRFFIKLKMDNGGIHLTKGLFFRRIYDIPISAVVAAEVACLEVAGEAFVGLVLAAVVAFGAMHLDVPRRAARIASEVYAFGFPTYHNWSERMSV